MDCIDDKQSAAESTSAAGTTTTMTTTQAQVTRKYITCDGCKVAVAPAIRCESCLTAYYCSQVCQKRHWPEHANDCHPIDRMRQLSLNSPQIDKNDIMRGWAMATQLSGKRTFEALLAQAEYCTFIELMDVGSKQLNCTRKC